MKSFFASAAMAAIAVAADGDTPFYEAEDDAQKLRCRWRDYPYEEWAWDNTEHECVEIWVLAEREKSRCAEEDGEWRTDWLGHDYCYTGTPYQVCVYDEGRHWERSMDLCYDDWEEVEKIMTAEQKAKCDAIGGEWDEYNGCRTGSEQEKAQEKAQDECDAQDGVWDWNNDICYESYDALDAGQCVAEGGQWVPNELKSYYLCYTELASQDCEIAGKAWLEETSSCMTYEEVDIYWCGEDGGSWNDENDQDDGKVGCDWSAAGASLASKKSKAAASSNTGMYAGISFGVIGLVAAGAMFAAATKKQVNDNEEGLLNDNDFSLV